MTQNPLSSAEVFLKISDQFRLGDLPTEQSHPLTMHLSEQSQSNLSEALSTLQEVDRQALQKFELQIEKLQLLVNQIQNVLQRGDRIFLCGCGATGRLSLSLEALWRQEHPASEQVISFMAGGDVALVHAIEGFEDHPELGARQLMELGFRDGDLLICCTEGGETPFVIGAALQAAEASQEPTAFLFCNPQRLLFAQLERCRRVFDHPRIRAFELSVGPMALCGSTRMQASTVLMAAVGLCLFCRNFSVLREQLQRLIQSFESVSYQILKPFTEIESEIYRQGDRLIYSAQGDEIAVFTDTTERAPTFSLQAFQPESTAENFAAPSWSFVECERADGIHSAWRTILQRRPRALNWREVHVKTTEDYLYSFDFSKGALARRQRRWPDFQFEIFRIHSNSQALTLQLRNENKEIKLPENNALHRQLILKMLLNAHSTLVMGRLNRYRGNWMTYVFPTNAKLVDRACRYIQGILAQEGVVLSYEKVVTAVFSKLPFESRDHSLVLELCRELKTGPPAC